MFRKRSGWDRLIEIEHVSDLNGAREWLYYDVDFGRFWTHLVGPLVQSLGLCYLMLLVHSSWAILQR